MKKTSSPWSKDELRVLKKLTSPIKIQQFLDGLDYDPAKRVRSPRHVMKDGKAHCFSGAILAAACLRFIGYPPLIMDLRATNDVDHALAIYKVDGHWGAVAKSNYVPLRYREPVYKTLRELAMTYFDFYFNSIGEKTLREFSVPFDLSRFDDRNWMVTDENLFYLDPALDKARHFRIIKPKMEKRLNIVPRYLMKAGLLDANPKGIFNPKRKGKYNR